MIPSFPPPVAPPDSSRPPRRGQRGAALLLVVAAVAVLTALTVDLAYSTRVSLQVAANARDELQATYLARSAVNVSRLVLFLQQQLDQAGGAAGQALGALLGGAAGQSPQFSIRLWELVPVDSATTALLLSGEGGREGAGKSRAFGELRGSYQAAIEDEDRKIDVPQLAGIGSGPGAQLLRFLQLVKERRYDALFDREDEWGGRFSRTDVVIAMKDWVDEDEVTSAITANPMMPFQPAFGDENYVYEHGSDRYRAKNARFDSLDELYLVAGVGDAFMAAFGDKLTVYPDVNAAINVNSSDPDELMVNALVMSNPPGIPQPPLLDPAFPDKLQAALQLARPLPFMAITVQQFSQILTALGVSVQPIYLQATNADARNPYGNRSTTFHVRATGKAGDVEKTLDVVVTFDARAGPLASDMGRLLHWREE